MAQRRSWISRATFLPQSRWGIFQLLISISLFLFATALSVYVIHNGGGTLKMPGLWESIIGGLAIFIGLFAFGIAICWLIKDPEGKRLQYLQTEDHESTDEKVIHKKELGLTETILAFGLIGLIAYIVSRRQRE